MTRTSCLSTVACAAMLAIAGYGCSGAGDTLPGSGSGGSTGPGSGSGGSVVRGSGGSGPFGSGGTNGGGSGGTVVDDAGGGNNRDAANPDRPRPGRDAAVDVEVDAGGGAMDMRGGGRDAVVADAVVADAGGIANCAPAARCRSANPEPTCMAMCPGGGERACACTAAGTVRCAACPRPDAGGTVDTGGTTDAGTADAGAAACPAGVATGMACMPNNSRCTSACPTGNTNETCVCRMRMWACFNACM